MSATTPILTAEDRKRLIAQGAIVKPGTAVPAEVKTLLEEWKAAMGRATAAYQHLRNIEERLCAKYRHSQGRRMPARGAYAEAE